MDPRSREKLSHSISGEEAREKTCECERAKKESCRMNNCLMRNSFQDEFSPRSSFFLRRRKKIRCEKIRWSVKCVRTFSRDTSSAKSRTRLRFKAAANWEEKKEKKTATANSASSTTKEKKERFVTTSAPFRPDDILLPNRRRRRKGTSCVRAFTHSHGYIYVNRIIHSGLPWIKFSLLHMCDVRPRRGRSSEQSELLATTTDRRPKIWLYNNQRILWAL